MQNEENGVQVIAAPHPFRVARVNFVTTEGSTLSEILAQAQPDAFLRRFAHIFVNDKLIPFCDWDDYIPNASDIVTIRVIPQGGGGGGKNPLKTITTIGIIAASFAFGPAVGATVLHGVGLGMQGLGLTTAVGRIVIGGLGMVLSNALVPTKSSNPGMAVMSSTGGFRDSPTLFIEGARNQVRPFGTIPVVLGKHKSIPPLMARTWTEIIGNDQFLRMIVCWGYGRLDIQELKIGETAIGEFDDVEIETVEGVSGDSDLTLFPDTISQDDFSVLLKQVDSWNTRTTESDTDEIIVDYVFARGLVSFNDSGGREDYSITFELQYRETGTAGDWLNPNITGANTKINTASVKLTVDYTGTGTRLVSRPGVRTRVREGYTFTEQQNVLDPVTDTGSQQIITSGIKAFNHPGIVTATVAGEGTTIKAVQVIVEGTDTTGNTITETLPAFTEDTPGSVSGAKTFATITKVTIPAQDGSVLEISVTNNKSSAVRYGFRWKVSSRGQYDVRTRRTTLDNTSTKIFDEITWSSLKSVTNEDPDNFGFPLAKTALSIRATNQLSSVVDELNAVVSSYALDYIPSGFLLLVQGVGELLLESGDHFLLEASSDNWEENLTSNPASLYRHVLQSDAMASPLADSRIDLPSLQTWHTFCEDNGFEFDMIRDFQTSVWEVLMDICIAGRAIPVDVDGKWGVVIDQAQTTPTQHFTPRNSWGFKAEKDFVDVPHGLRMRFANRDENWDNDERIVYDDGFSESNATLFEQLDAVGITDPDHVWKHGRFNLAQIRLRAEKYNLSVDFEYLVAKKGEMVLITHDILLVGLATGRIKAVNVDSAGDVTGVDVDEIFTMEESKNYGVSVRTRDDIEITRSIIHNTGDNTTITFDTVIPAANAPVVDDLIAFGESGSESLECLIVSIETQSELTARLQLTPYSSAVYTADTGTIPSFDSKVTPQAVLEAPVILNTRTDESVLKLGAGNTLIPRIAISHVPALDRFDATISAQIRVSSSGQNFAPVTISSQTKEEIIIEDIEQGETYDVRLQFVSPTHLPSDFSLSPNITVVGNSNPPNPLSNLTIQSHGASAILRWDRLEDLDVRFGGEVRFRHSHELDASAASWSASVGIGTSAKGSEQVAQLPLKAGTYLGRVFDKGGRASTVVKVDTKQATVLTYANVDNVTEETTFTGTHTNTAAIDNILKLAGVGLFDDIPDLDLVVDLDNYGGVELSGTYDFAANIDLTTVKKVRATTDINAIVTDTLDKIDEWTGNVDDRESWDGDTSGVADARVQERHTDDDPASSGASWSAWNLLESAEFNARGFEFRILLTTTDPSFNIVVSKLQVNIEEVT